MSEAARTTGRVWLPTRRWFVVAAAAAVVVAFSPWGGAIALGVAVAAFVVDALVGASLGAPQVDLKTEVRCGLGDERRARLELSHVTRRTMRVRVVLDLPDALLDEHDASAIEPREIVLPPRHVERFEVPLHARRRGTHEVGPVHLRVAGPLGLAWWQVRVDVNSAIEVVPGLTEAHAARQLVWNRQRRRAGLRAVRQRGDNGQFESLRSYVRGDDPRRIDWKATARRGSHIVRLYEAERSQHVMLCVDVGRLMVEDIGGRERVDAALSSAVALAEVARLSGDHVGLFVFSDDVHVALPPALHPRDRIARLLAGVEAQPVESDYPRALTRLARLLNRRSLVVLFGDIIDADVSRPLSVHMLQLARRHLPLFVALRHPRLAAAAMAPVDGVDEALHRAAANELGIARDKALAAVRSGGVDVVDASPDEAVVAAVDRYLQIKARGSL